MIITTKDEYISFSLENKSYANISIHSNHIKLELLETVLQFRNLKYATNLLLKVLDYLIIHFPLKKLYLNPLPLDRFGLNLQQLIAFYKKFGFDESSQRNIHAPFLMEKLLTD